MRMNMIVRNSSLLAFLLLAVGLSACEKDEDVISPVLSLSNCTGCHSDGPQILATADPDEGGEGENPGEG